MPKGSDLLVAALVNEGVERIFGVPEEQNLYVVEDVNRIWGEVEARWAGAHKT